MCSSLFMPDDQKNNQTEQNQQRTKDNQCKFKTKGRERIGICVSVRDDLFKCFGHIFTLLNSSGR